MEQAWCVTDKVQDFEFFDCNSAFLFDIFELNARKNCGHGCRVAGAAVKLIQINHMYSYLLQEANEDKNSYPVQSNAFQWRNWRIVELYRRIHSARLISEENHFICALSGLNYNLPSEQSRRPPQGIYPHRLPRRFGLFRLSPSATRGFFLEVLASPRIDNAKQRVVVLTRFTWRWM